MKIDEIFDGDWNIKRVIKWMLVIVVLMVIGSFFSAGGKILSTPARVLDKTLNTDNVISNYEWFFDVDAAYKARMNQVNQYKDFMQGENDKDERYRVRIELAAMQQTCRDLAAKYNANSEKMNTSIFKGWDLPSTLSITNCN